MIVFVVIVGIVRASSVMTGCVFMVVSLQSDLTCIFKCGKCLRPCVVSKTTLLLLMKCNPILGLVTLLITTKSTAKVLSPILNLNVAVANGFSNWP